MTDDRDDAETPADHDDQASASRRDEILDLVRALMAGGVHRPPPVDAAPTVTLVRWRVVRVHGHQHLLGWSLEDHEGRISSPVTMWSAGARRAVTRSGRVYALEGPPGWDSEASYLLGAWLRKYGWCRDEAEDVTDAVDV